MSRRTERLLSFDLGDLIEERITGFSFTCRSRDPIRADFSEPMAYMVRRDRFDHALCLRAVEAGAELREGQVVRAARQRGNRIEVEVDGRTEIADFLIGADGAAGVVARDVFPGRPQPKAVGLDGEIMLNGEAEAELRGRVVLDVGRAPGGYCWIFPKGGMASVGVMVSREVARRASGLLEAFLGSGSFAGRKATRTHGALIPLHPESGWALHRGRALLAGDAAALVDPFLGEGIYYAIQSGQMAARAIVETANNGGDLADYQRAIMTEIIPELDAAAGLSRQAHRLTWLWFSLLKRRRGMIDHFRKVLMGEENYRSFADRVWAQVPKPLALLLRHRSPRSQQRGV